MKSKTSFAGLDNTSEKLNLCISVANSVEEGLAAGSNRKVIYCE